MWISNCKKWLNWLKFTRVPLFYHFLVMFYWGGKFFFQSNLDYNYFLKSHCIQNLTNRLFIILNCFTDIPFLNMVHNIVWLETESFSHTDWIYETEHTLIFRCRQNIKLQWKLFITILSLTINLPYKQQYFLSPREISIFSMYFEPAYNNIHF